MSEEFERASRMILENAERTRGQEHLVHEVFDFPEQLKLQDIEKWLGGLEEAIDSPEVNR